MGDPPTRKQRSLLLDSVIRGQAYRASQRKSLNDGQELIIHIDPVAAGGTVYLEPPRVNPEERADFDVFENADPGDSTNSNLNVHNMRYDGDETPQATVTSVDSGGLDTTGADQTEETLIDQNNSDIGVGEGARGIYRIIPVADTISMVITDRSGGNNNDYSIDLTLHEGDALPP